MYDSDTILLTDDNILIKAAQRNYDRFAVPTNFLSAKKIKRYYTASQKADLDVKTSVNKIGEDVNLSQQLNSLFWNNVNNGQTIEDNLELYGDICKLAVLSNAEIDKAKKEYEVNTGLELNIIKRKYIITNDSGQTVKPMFFKTITTENGYELSKRIEYKYFETPMDYLQKKLKTFSFMKGKAKKNSFVEFKNIFLPVNQKIEQDKKAMKQAYLIMDTIKDYVDECKRLFSRYSTMSPEEKEDIRYESNEERLSCIDKVTKKCTDKNVAYALICMLENEEYKSYVKKVFDILFSVANPIFFEILVNDPENIHKLEESEDGDIELFDYSFKKVSIV